MQASNYITTNALAILSPSCLDLIDKLAANPDFKSNIPQAAYVLATIKHETANTYKPIAEYGLGKGKNYGQPDPITKQAYFGRGYVQLTWKYNYAQFGRLLKLDLLNHPELAMKPDVALSIIEYGMINGSFTGKKLSDYIHANGTDYVNARRIINGLDQATLIAGYATSFEQLLNKVYPNI